jgi:hypothetical protein
MRNPAKLFRELGAGGFLSFNVILGGTPLISFLNPLFWLMAILWFLAKFNFIQVLFPGWVYYPAMLCMVVGNFMLLYQAVISLRLTGRPDLLTSVFLLPVYWVIMAAAALRAFLQLVTAPTFWEKTVHGLVPQRIAAGIDEGGVD